LQTPSIDHPALYATIKSIPMTTDIQDKTEPCVLLEWDSEFWKLAIGRVCGVRLGTERLADVDAWAKAHDIHCLYFLAPADDRDTVEVAEESGFRLVDVRVELTQTSTELGPVARVRPHRTTDVRTLREIARASHHLTRFYTDPHFPRTRCDDLYDTWIARSCEGWADEVLVAELDGRPAGYVTCHLDRASSRGSIGLIAVSADARGNGLGRDLVLASLAWCCDEGATEVSVVTQGANVAAQRLFQSCGFRTYSTGLWFHRWYGN